jgi:hypothetical protein
MTDQFEGGCLCGAVRFVATGEPESVAWCHCQSCRKHSGAPVSVFAAFKNAAYVVTKDEIIKVQFVARQVAGILRQVRVDVDLRRRALARNAFPYRCIRSGRATSADEAHIPGGAPAVVASSRRLVSAAVMGGPKRRPLSGQSGSLMRVKSTAGIGAERPITSGGGRGASCPILALRRRRPNRLRWVDLRRSRFAWPGTPRL